jgi:hypothetical protein
MLWDSCRTSTPPRDGAGFEPGVAIAAADAPETSAAAATAATTSRFAFTVHPSFVLRDSPTGRCPP